MFQHQTLTPKTISMAEHKVLTTKQEKLSIQEVNWFY